MSKVNRKSSYSGTLPSLMAGGPVISLLIISFPCCRQRIEWNWHKGSLQHSKWNKINKITSVKYLAHWSVSMDFSLHIFVWYSVQFSSVAQLCLTLCDPMNCSTPDPVHHQLLEPTQTHVHWVDDAIQPSHPLSFPSPPTFNLSQPQGLFRWVSSSHQVAKVLEFQLQHQSFQWTHRTDLL